MGARSKPSAVNSELQQRGNAALPSTCAARNKWLQLGRCAVLGWQGLQEEAGLCWRAQAGAQVRSGITAHQAAQSGGRIPAHLSAVQDMRGSWSDLQPRKGSSNCSESHWERFILHELCQTVYPVPPSSPVLAGDGPELCWPPGGHGDSPAPEGH